LRVAGSRYLGTTAAYVENIVAFPPVSPFGDVYDGYGYQFEGTGIESRPGHGIERKR